MGITVDGKTLFELPIYRVSKETYQKNFNQFYEKRKIPNIDLQYEKNLKQNLFKVYGGTWKYNEIIGYLRFYKCANDIRCFYYKVDKQIIKKSRTKQFIPINDTIHKIVINSSFSNEQIVKKLNDMVDYCSKLLDINKRYVDRENFDNIVEHIDWKSFLKSENKR